MHAARLLLLPLLILATTLVALPSAAAQTTQNLLTNADFEGNGIGFGCCSNVSEGWSPFWRIREPNMEPWQFHEPQFGNNWNDRRRNGMKSMSWGKDYATHDAGIWQRVKLPASSGKLTFTAWMTSWSGNGNTWGDSPQGGVVKLIGIDPTGATDVWAPTVVWSPENRVAVEWTQLTVSTEARGEFATVFIRSRNDLPMQRNAVFVDDVVLAQASSAPPTPVAPATDQPRDQRYFNETGFRISDDAFWNYFHRRGGVRTFGYPVSRSFRLMGTEVQIFQRRVMQKQPNGQVGLLNVLDQDFMPYNSFNGAQVPPYDAALVATAPPPGSANYATAVLEYVRRVAPDQWMGLPVGFQRTFSSSVTAAEVFVGVPANPALLPGIQLELWGVPTSQPMADPNNSNFVFQRWQRGVMHYDRTTSSTQGLLLADYFKSILTGSNLPSDVADAARNSRFFQQYDPSRPRSVARPDQLPDTDMTNAFAGGPTS